MSSNLTDAAPGETGVDLHHPAAVHLRIIDADKAVIEATPPRERIAVCGFAASSRMLAPFDDPTWEIWTLNQLYRHVPRADRHFDIHANWREDNVPGTDHPAWLARCGIPVYMVEREPSIPTAVRYPLEAVIASVAGIDYFTSTVAFMLGEAIRVIDLQVEAELRELDHAAVAGNGGGATFADLRARLATAYGRRAIGIYGIDLIVGTEYDYQKACVEFLLGIAQARGITVHIPPQAALLKQHWRYGYETEPKAWPVNFGEMKKRQEALQNERNGLIARLQTLDGALQENGYWLQVMDLRLKGGTVKLNEDT